MKGGTRSGAGRKPYGSTPEETRAIALIRDFRDRAFDIDDMEHRRYRSILVAVRAGRSPKARTKGNHFSDSEIALILNELGMRNRQGNPFAGEWIKQIRRSERID